MKRIIHAVLFGTFQVPAPIWRNRCYWPLAAVVIFLMGRLFGQLFLR